MRCAQCGWPNDEAEVLSTHPTSEGWVRYRRCVCGTVRIELVAWAQAGERAEAAATPLR